MADRADAPILSAQQVAFCESGVSIAVASAGVDGLPSLADAVACQVLPGRRRVRLFVYATRSRQWLADIERSGRIAAAFTQPSTHLTLQLKGVDAQVDDGHAPDPGLLDAHLQAFADEVRDMGFDPDFMDALVRVPGDEVVAVSFTIADRYEQTPGPRAGARLP